jgi:putative addiction module component (TIGR02574 family)
MLVTLDSILDAAMTLSPQDRCLVASRLWESSRPTADDISHDELEQELATREAELEQDPSLELSHEAFLSHFANRRSK